MDCVQKYNVTIEIYTGYGAQRRLLRTINLTDTWLEGSENINWQGRGLSAVGTMNVDGSFVLITAQRKWKLHGGTLTEYRRANDKDGDYIPNLVEDAMGLNWQAQRTHGNHARSASTTSSGGQQVPDQEFYADQYAFDRWNLVEPGHPELDWANPGAQSDPEYD